MHFHTIQTTTNPTTPDSVIQASAVPGLLHVIPLRENGLKSSVEERLSINLQFKKVTNKSLQQNEGHLPLVPHCTTQRNKCPYSFFSPLTDCIGTHLPQHLHKPAPPKNLNIIIRPKLK
jgi:hypothetical protein